MRRFQFLLLGVVALGSMAATAPEGSHARQQELIRALHMSTLPKESGYLGLIGGSAQTVSIEGRRLAVQSQVYYMLTRDKPINYLHWLASDDTHILIEGGPVDYYIFHPDGHAEVVTLGHDVTAGQRPVVAVPGGCWKALRLHKGASMRSWPMHSRLSSLRIACASAREPDGSAVLPAPDRGRRLKRSKRLSDRTGFSSGYCRFYMLTTPRDSHALR